MGEFRAIEMTIPEAVAQTGVTYPNPMPLEDISLLTVAWNEAGRIDPLLEYLKPYFAHSVICVQASDDDTLDLARQVMDRPDDKVITDRHWGHGDASFSRMLKQTETTWAFVVSCDEWPTQELLETLQIAVAVAELDSRTSEAVWVPFRSWIDGLATADETAHLRMFKRRVGWPSTLHSRPMTQKGILWPYGWIEHRRSLDEMMRDYLSYYRVGRGSPSWENHNREMMRNACTFVAGRKGWNTVTEHEWWPEVRALAFGEETPWLNESQ